MNQRDLDMAKKAIEQIAKREGVSKEYVREQMELTILSGLASDHPQSRAYWQSIPCEGEMPTPEEFIVFFAKQINKEA